MFFILFSIEFVANHALLVALNLSRIIHFWCIFLWPKKATGVNLLPFSISVFFNFRWSSAGLLIRNLGIPTGGNWLKYLIPNLGFDSPAYSQSGNWFPQEFPLEGIDWNIWISLFLWHSSKTGNWLNLISHHWELAENFVPI